MDLSIIIVNWNTRDFVLGCIDSIINSENKIKYEIIVVDNGSSDGSQDAFKNLIKSRRNIEVVLNKTNAGFAKACNQGIKKSSGKFILLLNSDTIVVKDSLSKLVKFALSKKDAGVVGGRLLNKDGSFQESVMPFPSVLGAIREFWFNKKNFYSIYSPSGSDPIIVDAVVGACFLITPQALKKVGFLDERYFMYYEDLDYCRRVYKNGLKVYFLPDAKILHFLGESGKNILQSNTQWRRLIPSSKIYHGIVGHYLIYLVIRIGQLCSRLLKRN